MGLPLKIFQKFQLLQNAVAQAATGAKYTAHVTPLLHELQWLLIYFQVKFKLPVVSYKALNGLGTTGVPEGSPFFPKSLHVQPGQTE